MTWDDTKTNGSSLAATEWNAMVSDQKTRVSNTTTINSKALSTNINLVPTDIGTELSLDTTPQLGGELDAQAHSIGFTAQGLTSATGVTIDWRNGNKAYITLGHNVTFTFTNPSKPCNLCLKLTQDSTGSRTVTWDSDCKWSAGTAPVLTTGTGKTDIVSFYFDGTNYYGSSSLNY